MHGKLKCIKEAKNKIHFFRISGDEFKFHGFKNYNDFNNIKKIIISSNSNILNVNDNKYVFDDNVNGNIVKKFLLNNIEIKNEKYINLLEKIPQSGSLAFEYMYNKYRICDDKNNKIYLVGFTSIYLKNNKNNLWYKHSKELEDLYFSLKMKEHKNIFRL